MPKNPKISIVMPAYNVEDFILDCLGSIVIQTWTNWELIVVDDQSTDNTLGLINLFALKDPRIQVFTSKTKGIIPALSLAESNCTGELITRMDADDLMAPNKLLQLANPLLTQGTGHISVGFVEYFSEQKLGEGYLKYALWLNHHTASKGYQDIYKECVLPSPNWMMHRSDLVAVGGFSTLNYPEDYDLCFKAYRAQYKILPVLSITHHWRDWVNRSSRTSPHYADNAFSELKIKYFLELEHDSQEQLTLWGAGKKGKKIAQLLLEHQVDFKWICDNPNKIGHEVYGRQLSAAATANLNEGNVIVAVAGPQDQLEIRNQLSGKNARVHFFC